MKNIYVVFTFIVFSFLGNAQEKHSVIFNSYTAIGFVAGKAPVDFAAQTENGIGYKNWFIGAGLGIDLYYKTTLPVFIAIKKEFPLKNNSWFIYANGGTHTATNNKKNVGTFSTITTKGGFYGDAGIGYKIKTRKRQSVFFTIGNTIKNMEETEVYDNGFGMPGIYYTQNKLSRIAFKMGYQF